VHPSIEVAVHNCRYHDE